MQSLERETSGLSGCGKYQGEHSIFSKIVLDYLIHVFGGRLRWR